MKIPYKHILLLSLVVIALATLFIPMAWEKDLYPKHLLIKKNAEKPPQPFMTKIPDFDNTSPLKEKQPEVKAWSIQLSSFKDIANVISFENSLRKAHYPAYLEKSDDNAGMIRVMVGPYASLDEAKQESKIISKAFNLKTIVSEYKTANIKEFNE